MHLLLEQRKGACIILVPTFGRFKVYFWSLAAKVLRGQELSVSSK